MAKEDRVKTIIKAQEEGKKYYHFRKKKKAGKNTVNVAGHNFTMENLADFFIQSRGFPTILTLGEVSGEGQSGGRYVTELAHKVEDAFAKKYGEKKYVEMMRKTVKNREKLRKVS